MHWAAQLPPQLPQDDPEDGKQAKARKKKYFRPMLDDDDIPTPPGKGSAAGYAQAPDGDVKHLIKRATALPPCPYVDLSYLVVEDSPLMRKWLRNTIAEMGGKKIATAESYNDALFRIRSSGDFDVVLCDYILSDTRDGQMLLEEVRRNKLLPQSTLWIMITGERNYGQVFSAAELAPDDYLIKPITPAILMERLERAWNRRLVLKVATTLFDSGRYAEALVIAKKQAVESEQHAIDFQRIAGECLLQLDQYAEAYRHYEHILESRPRLPWARLGKGRAFFHMDRHDEAQDILESLIKDSPDFLKAHDVIAKVHERKGDLESSKQVLKAVLQKNPKALHRHREVVRVAQATNDPSSAIEAYALMHQHGRGSSFLTPGDFCGYAGLLMSSASKGAQERLDALNLHLRDYHKDDQGFALAGHMISYAAETLSGNAQGAAQAYARMSLAHQQAQGKGLVVDTEQSMALMNIALKQGDQAMALACAGSLYNDHFGNESMTGRVNKALLSAGLSAMGAKLAEESSQRLKELNKAAINLAKHGQLQEAVKEFQQLATVTPSVFIYLNAATAIAKLAEEVRDGRIRIPLDEQRSHSIQMQAYLKYVRDKDPGNARLTKIENVWKACHFAV